MSSDEWEWVKDRVDGEHDHLLLGSSVPFLLPDGMPPLPAKAITRSFETLSASTAEAQSARVFAGIHFREGCQAGAKPGILVARFVAQHSLTPLKGAPTNTE